MALVLIVAAGLALRVIYNFGLVWVDSFTYADAAISMARWEPVFSPHVVGDVYYTQYVRLTLIAPAALLYKLFGESDTASSVFPVALSLGMAPLAFWFTRRFAWPGSRAGTIAGLAAAGLMAIFPWSVIVSTQFMPDGVQAAFLAIATVCLLVALYDEGLSRRQLLWLWFGAGAAFALAFYARGTAVAVLPGFALAGLFRWRQLLCRETIAGLAGGLAVLVLFQLLLMGTGSAPLEDFRVLFDIGSRTHPNIDWGFRDFLLSDGKFWPFTVASAVGLVCFVVRTRPRAILRSPLTSLALIAVFEYIYFEFFMDLPGTATFRKEQRYILPLAFPMLVFGGIGVGTLVDLARKHSRWAAAGVTVALAAAFLFTTVRGMRDEYGYWVSENHRIDAVQQQVAAFLASQPKAPVYVWNDDFARPLSTRMGSAGTFYERSVSKSGLLRNRFDGNGTSQVTPGSYVVVLPVEKWWALPTAPADDWTKVWSGADGTAVFHVGEPSPDSIQEHQVVAAPPGVGGTRLTAVGFTRDWVLPGEHTGIELDFDAPLPSKVSLPLALRCGDALGAPATLELPAGATTFRCDVLLAPPAGAGAGMCDVVANINGWTKVGDLRLPAFALFQAEDLAGTARAAGWASYAQPFLSQGGALLGREDALFVSIPIPALAAGQYWVDLLVYDYGTGAGTITAALNGKTASAKWGALGEAHVARVTIPMGDVAAGADLTLTFEKGAQPAVLFDAAAVVSEEPPAR
jgi:4-amino-4-deoxy-L-arabinose transferase-like glycosyltransferase